MKIVHLCLAARYADGYAYQENMLPKYHRLLGYDVEIIASLETFDRNGKPAVYNGPLSYNNEDAIKVKRLLYKKPIRLYRRLRRYTGLKEALKNSNADILFVHNCQFRDISVVIWYINQYHPIKIYVDNHADFANSASGWISKNILHKIIWKRCAQSIEPYTTLFYGVLPARVDFLKQTYGLPVNKCKLLVMGADDILVEKAQSSGLRGINRLKHSIREDDFLVVTGGKINKNRPETLDLMRAIKEINRNNVKLLVFGVVDDAYQQEFETLCAHPSIIYIGWIKSEDTYGYFSAADLVVFPGLHSVMWEQAVAQGKPCIFRDLEGFHHVDIGGNADFVRDVSVNGVKEALLKVIDDPDHYQEMKTVAEEKGMNTFSYRNIARRSIEE